MQSLIYDSAKLALWTAKLNLATDPIWAMLVDGTYVPNAAHKLKSEVTGEIVTPGYVAGGQLLTGQQVAIEPSTHMLQFKANKLIWKGAAIQAAGLILYRKTTDGSPPTLICCLGFGQDGLSNVDFTVGSPDGSLLNF